MHDQFDDELKNRLDNYSEDPDDKLWSGIASNIASVKPTPSWGKWSIRGASVAVGVVAITALVFFINKGEEVGPGKQDLISANGDQQIQSKQDEVITQNKNESSTSTLSDKKQLTTEPENKNINEAAGLERVAEGKEVTFGPAQNNNAGLRPGNDLSVIDKRNRKNDQMHAGRTGVAKESDISDRVTEEKTTSLQKNLNAPVSNSVALETESRAANVEDNSAESVNKDGDKSKDPIVTDMNANFRLSHSPSPDSSAVDHVVKESITTSKSVTENDQDDKKTDRRKLSLYFTAMPTFGYQRIEANKSDNVMIESIQKVSNFSSKRLGVRVEIGAEYPLSKKMKAFGGLLYYQRKQTIDYVEKVPGAAEVTNVEDTVITLDPQFSYVNRSFDYELRNIGVQLGINYVLSEGKFLHVLGTGIEFHKALNSLPDDQKQSGFNKNPSTYVFSNFYYRVQYPAQGKLKAVFQPTFNYSMYLNKDFNAPFYVKPYGLGLNLGLTYNF